MDPVVDEFVNQYYGMWKMSFVIWKEWEGLRRYESASELFRNMNREDENLADLGNLSTKKSRVALETGLADLAKLYREGSRLTLEGQKIKGKDSILAKFISHPFTRCQHSIKTVDCHPSDAAGGRLVFVNGVLYFVRLDGEQHALNFSQTFQLMPSPEGGFYILNDMFRVGETTPPQSQVTEGVAARAVTVIHT